MSDTPKRGIVIRPPRGRTIAKFLGLQALLLPTSAYAAFTAKDLFTRLIGMAGLLLFGVGGVFALAKLMRRTWSLALTPEGIAIYGGGTVPWDDLEAVGVAEVARQRMLGLRLTRPDRYLASRAATVSRGTVPQAAMAKLMYANRALCGYDIAFPWSDLDRPVDATVVLIQDHWPAPNPHPA